MAIVTRCSSRSSYAFFQKGLVVADLAGALLGLIGVYITCAA